MNNIIHIILRLHQLKQIDFMIMLRIINHICAIFSYLYLMYIRRHTRTHAYAHYCTGYTFQVKVSFF